MKKFWLQEAGPEGSRALIGFRDANCAKRALAYMSGQPINGHAYRACREGQEPSTAGLAHAAAAEMGEGASPCNVVEIRNLVMDLQKEELRDRFKRYGTIQEVEMIREQPTNREKSAQYLARVTYETLGGAEAAIKNMNRTQYCSRTIRVAYFDPIAAKEREAAMSQPAPTPSEPRSRDSGSDSRDIDGNRRGQGEPQRPMAAAQPTHTIKSPSPVGSAEPRRQQQQRPPGVAQQPNGSRGGPPPLPAANGDNKVLIKELSKDVTEVKHLPHTPRPPALPAPDPAPSRKQLLLLFVLVGWCSMLLLIVVIMFCTGVAAR